MGLMVIGCGNRMAGDDSAGLEILRRLEAQGAGDCIFRALPPTGIELLEIFSEADVILFVDAVASGAPAGSLHLVSLPSADAKPRALETISSHGWSLPETLNLAQALGRRIPRIILLGIELESAIHGTELSPAVSRAIDRVMEGFPIVELWLRNLSARDLPVSKLFAPDDDSFPGNLRSGESGMQAFRGVEDAPETVERARLMRKAQAGHTEQPALRTVRSDSDARCIRARLQPCQSRREEGGGSSR